MRGGEVRLRGGKGRGGGGRDIFRAQIIADLCFRRADLSSGVIPVKRWARPPLWLTGLVRTEARRGERRGAGAATVREERDMFSPIWPARGFSSGGAAQSAPLWSRRSTPWFSERRGARS